MSQLQIWLNSLSHILDKFYEFLSLTSNLWGEYKFENNSEINTASKLLLNAKCFFGMFLDSHTV